MAEMYNFWCYIKGDNTHFPVIAPPTISIGVLQMKIKEAKSNLLQRVDASNLTLSKDDVKLKGVEDKIYAGTYQLELNNQRRLQIGEKIYEVWPKQPHDEELHVFVTLPDKVGGQVTAHGAGIPETYPSDALFLHEAAEKLHKAMWRQDLEGILQDVDQCKGLKFVPAEKVKELQLRELICNAKAILVREEYTFALKAMEGCTMESGGIIVTGHPGIGKSIFVFYTLLHLLSEGKPVALQRDGVFFIFREAGVEMHRVNSLGLFFHSEEKPWALSDSTERSRFPCSAFQSASVMGCAWIVQATSPATDRHDRLRKECNTGLFIMSCFTREESRALSIIHGLDVESFLKNFDKWGPSARTCLRLAGGTITEQELKNKMDMVTKKFAENPTAITMESNSEADSHLLFTTIPDGPERNSPILRVATPYLCRFVVRAIAKIDAARQISFYSEASSHPFFRGAFGYVFEKFFYIWLSSNPDNKLSCTARPRSAESSRSTRSTNSMANEQVEQLHLQPVGLEKVIVHGGESGKKGYKSANEHQTPFSWIPASRSDATFDAVICTDKNIITVQVTVAAELSMNEKGFTTLSNILPKEFQKHRKWCHVFITDCADTAAKLGRKNYNVANKFKFSIYTAVLDISLFQYSPEVWKRAQALPSSIGMDDDDVEMEI